MSMIDIQNLAAKSVKLFELLRDSGMPEEKVFEEMVKLEDKFYRDIITDILGDVTGEKLTALDKMYEDKATQDQIAAFLNINEEELKRRLEEKIDLYCKNFPAGTSAPKIPSEPTAPPPSQI